MPPTAPDRLPEAHADLRSRARGVRLRAAASCLIAPLLAAYPGYFLLQRLQARLFGGTAWPLVSALLVALPVLIGLRASGKLARRVLLRRRDAWLDAVAAKYRVPRNDLVKHAGSWGL